MRHHLVDSPVVRWRNHLTIMGCMQSAVLTEPPGKDWQHATLPGTDGRPYINWTNNGPHPDLCPPPLKMGNIVSRAKLEPTSLVFRASVLPLHHISFPNVTTIPTPTCLCNSLFQRSMQTTTELTRRATWWWGQEFYFLFHAKAGFTTFYIGLMYTHTCSHIC